MWIQKLDLIDKDFNTTLTTRSIQGKACLKNLRKVEQRHNKLRSLLEKQKLEKLRVRCSLPPMLGQWQTLPGWVGAQETPPVSGLP